MKFDYASEITEESLYFNIDMNINCYIMFSLIRRLLTLLFSSVKISFYLGCRFLIVFWRTNFKKMSFSPTFSLSSINTFHRHPFYITEEIIHNLQISLQQKNVILDLIFYVFKLFQKIARFRSLFKKNVPLPTFKIFQTL